MEEGFEKLDLSGKLIIKATVGTDIRRIPIHNDDLTYDELVLMMQRVFKSVISTDDDLLLKYKDEDGDLVTITDSADLSYAIQYCRVLKLSVIVNPEAGGVNANSENHTNIHPNVIKELINIRDRVTRLLDTIHKDTKLKPINGDEDGKDNLEASGEQVTQDNLPKMTTEGREFDPLTAIENQQNIDQQNDTNHLQGHISSNQEPPTPTTNPSLFSASSSFPQQPAEYQTDQKAPEIPQPSTTPTSNQSQSYQPASSTQNYPNQTPTSYQTISHPTYPQETPQSNYPGQTPSVPQPSYTPSTGQTPNVPRPSYVPPQQAYPSYTGSTTYPGPPSSSASFPSASNNSPTYPGAAPSTYPGAAPSSYPGAGQSYPGATPAAAPGQSYPGTTPVAAAPGQSYPGATPVAAAPGQSYPGATPASGQSYPGTTPSATPGQGYLGANPATAAPGQAYPGTTPAYLGATPSYPGVSGGFPNSPAAATGNPYSSGRQPRYSHPATQPYN